MDNLIQQIVQGLCFRNLVEERYMNINELITIKIASSGKTESPVGLAKRNPTPRKKIG